MGRIGQHRHAAQVLGWVERQLGVDRGADGQRTHVAQQHGVAIRLGLGNIVSAQIAIGSGLVFDDHGLFEQLRQRLADRARNDVRAAAWRVGHDDAQGLGRPLCRLRSGDGGGGCQGSGAGQEDRAALQMHGVSPISYVVSHRTTKFVPTQENRGRAEG
ncbi:hypothetical protein D3C71_1270540 [compost metagenome]